MKIQSITATPVAIDYVAPVGPYVGRGAAGIGGTPGAAALIVRIDGDDGLVGWGEGTGTLEGDVDELLRGHHVADTEAAVLKLEQAGIGRGPISGIEMAMWDLFGKAVDLPVCRLLGGGVVRDRVDFCACMGLKEPTASAATARTYLEQWGFRYLKTKAGRDLEEDLRIAAAIQREIGDEAALRPDANSGYGPDEATNAMEGMLELGVHLFEDPCTAEHLDLLARFREMGMRIFVNMGVTTADELVDVLRAGAADSVMPDTPAAGGIFRVKKVAETAAAWGVSALTHCAHDLGLKTAAITHIAACTPGLSGANDTCYHGLSDDVLTEPLQFEGGALRVPMAPGLGVEVDPGKVEKYRSDR